MTTCPLAQKRIQRGRWSYLYKWYCINQIVDDMIYMGLLSVNLQFVNNNNYNNNKKRNTNLG